MDLDRPDIPEGVYTIAGSQENADVYFGSDLYLSEIRVRWLPDDAAHQPLNEMLAHISVLELDHLAQAAGLGEPFVVEALDDLLPRPGWEIQTRVVDDPSHYLLRKMGTDVVHRGSRRELLLLLELAARSAVAPHLGEAAPHEWVRRLRAVHPQLVQALDGAARFERTVDS
jgi:hypothetical protein